MENKKIRQATKAALKDNWGAAAGSLGILLGITFGIVLIMYFIFFSLILAMLFTASLSNTIDGALLIWLPLFLIIYGFIFLVIQVFATGQLWAYLDLVDGKKFTATTMFQIFNKRFFKTVGLLLVIGLLTLLWSLLLVIPGIIKAWSYSLALSIYKDQPEIGILAAITESRRLMKGKKWHYFLLTLSYSWQYILPYLVILLLNVTATFTSSSLLGVFTSLAMLLYMLYVFGMQFYLYPQSMTAMQIFYRSLKPLPSEPLDLSKDTDFLSYPSI